MANKMELSQWLDLVKEDVLNEIESIGGFLSTTPTYDFLRLGATTHQERPPASAAAETKSKLSETNLIDAFEDVQPTTTIQPVFVQTVVNRDLVS